jgi:uncharacterized repeat protein (TIGR01451 family)
MAHWIVIAGLILAASLLLDLPLLAYAAEALLAVLVVSRFLARQWVTSLSATRRTSRLDVEPGDTVTITVELRNTGLLPILWCLAEDLLPRDALMFDPPDLEQIGRRRAVVMIPPRGTTRLLYDLRCHRRGYYQLGPLVIETGDLFGLHRRYRVLTTPDFLQVAPKVLPLPGYDIRSRRPLGEVRLAHRLFEDPTRISGVRQYLSGDPLRRVHWRASARTGTLQSKQYDPSTVAGATLLVDFHRSSHDRRHEPYRSELAITAAASLANAVYETGQQVGLVTNGRDAADRIRIEGWGFDIRSRTAARTAASMLPQSDRLRPVVVETRSGPDQLLRILKVLARLELTDGLSFLQLVGEALPRIPRQASVVAILPEVTEQSAMALGMLRRQGFAVTAVLNIYDAWDFAAASGPLVALGIDTTQLVDEAAIQRIVAPVVHAATH